MTCDSGLFPNLQNILLFVFSQHNNLELMGNLSLQVSNSLIFFKLGNNSDVTYTNSDHIGFAGFSRHDFITLEKLFPFNF